MGTLVQKDRRTTRKLVLEYLPKQGEFLQNCHEARYNGYIGGFGSGKTHVLVLQSMRESQFPSRGLIGAPT